MDLVKSNRKYKSLAEDMIDMNFWKASSEVFLLK
jgi:hypothetical protein